MLTKNTAVGVPRIAQLVTWVNANLYLGGTTLHGHIFWLVVWNHGIL